MAQFIVQYTSETECYMVLLGPFEYQLATADIQQATIMPRSKATAYAEMWSAKVIQVS